MAPASTATTAAFILKNFYGDISDVSQFKRPILKMVPKKEGVIGGAGHVYSILYGNPQGVAGGSNFSTAQTNVSASNGKQLTAAAKVKYGYTSIDGVAMLKAAAEGKAAFMSLFTMEVDGIISEVSDSLAFDLYRNGTCARGQRSSISSNTVTLTNADDARYFKKGMTVKASPNADLSSPRSGSTTVSKVSISAGTVTLTDQSAISSFANSDYLYRSGEENTGVEGMASIFPLTEPTSGDSHRGIDRSDDPDRLAGGRIDDTATAIEENVGLANIKVDQIGQDANVCLINPRNFWTVVKRQGAKITYDGGGNKATVGFEGIDVATSSGTVRMVADPFCPTNRFYVGSLDTLYLAHLKAYPHVIMDDTLKALRLAADDGVEVRVRAVGNLVCTKPASWCVGSI